MSALVANPTDALQKRRRSPSGSPPAREGSPPRNRVRVEMPRIPDSNPARRAERERQMALRMAEKELDNVELDKPKFDAQAEFQKLLGSSRAGGVYIPPARLKAMQAANPQDKSSAEYQRISWDALRKSITGIVNRVNVTNIKHIVPELFNENLIRGRGLFCRSIMKAQAASLPFTPVFAALVAIVNTKFPQIGELLLSRLLSQFRRAFKRNDKVVCISSSMFIAHLVNQSVASAYVGLQIPHLLVEHPTDDSIEIAVGFIREAGAFLAENVSDGNNALFERLRAILNEGTISQRVQYMIEVLMQVRKDKYKDNPIMPEGLDLVMDEEVITHEDVVLEGDLKVQEGLNVFKFDPDFLENEEKYRQLKAEILGEDSDNESGSGSGSDSDEEEGEEEVPEKEGIEDLTGTNLVNLRRVIYLTIMNALGYEEAVHKLLKIQLEEGQEIELCKMIIECCSQERSYSKFYGLIGERFCKLNRVWCECFHQTFSEYYDTIHRYETNRLRNIARFFGHLLSTDSISWVAFEVVKMNEDDTTSSSRIFIKILLQEVMEAMGLKTLVERFKDPEVRSSCRYMFPIDNPKNTRFAINYFTSIGLGAVTEEMREHLKNAPRLIMEQRRALMEEESSSSDTDTDTTSSSDDSDTDSESRSRARSRSRSGSEPPSRRRRYSSDSRSPPPRRQERERQRAETPPRTPPRGYRDRKRTDSRSPPPRSPPRRSGGGYRQREASRSPPPPSRRRVSPSPPRRNDANEYRGRANSRSPPPPPRNFRGRRASQSPPRSPPPPRRSNGRRERSYDRDRNENGKNFRSYSRSQTPPRRRPDRDRSMSHERPRR